MRSRESGLRARQKGRRVRETDRQTSTQTKIARRKDKTTPSAKPSLKEQKKKKGGQLSGIYQTVQERQTGCYQSSRRHEYRWLPPPCSFLPSAGTQHCSTSSHPLSHMIFGTGAAGSPMPDRIRRWRRLGYAFKAPHGHGSPSPSLNCKRLWGVTLVWPLVIIVVLISRVLKAHSFRGAK